MHIPEISKYRASKLRKVSFSLSLRSYNNYLLALSLLPFTYFYYPNQDAKGLTTIISTFRTAKVYIHNGKLS